MATSGRRTTGSQVRPSAAARPMAPGSRTVPAASATAPRATSVPAGRTKRPASPGRSKRASPAVTVTRSCISTPSAPRGSGAPVKIRRQVPGRTAPRQGWPAATVPTSRSRAPAAGTSAARKAKPSMVEAAKGGSGRVAASGEASARPPASTSGTRSGRSGPARRACARMRSRASAGVNTPDS